MILPIVTYPNPLLKKRSVPVQHFDKELRTLVDNMFETMYAAPGVGLAAPQVGILERVLVIDVGRLEGDERKADPRVIINPGIGRREGKVTWEEGCLSLPGLVIPVERDKKIVVTGKDPDGREVTIDGEDLLAVAFQHEVDHLDGILLVDRLSRLKRDLYRHDLAKAGRVREPVVHGTQAYFG
jgi:peptide deformylase